MLLLYTHIHVDAVRGRGGGERSRPADEGGEQRERAYGVMQGRLSRVCRVKMKVKDN